MKWKAFNSSTRRQWPTSQRDLNLTLVQKRGLSETCRINWNSQLWKLKGSTSRWTRLKANRGSLITLLRGPAPSTRSRSPFGISLMTIYSNNSDKLSFRKIKCRLRRNRIWNHTGQSPIWISQNWAVQIQSRKVHTILSNASRSVPSHRKLNYSKRKRRNIFSHQSPVEYPSRVVVLKQA